MRFWLALVLIVGCDGEIAVSRRKIVGGELAGARFPSVAKLVLDFGASGTLVYCTGTLVAPEVVLTAAHCSNGRTIGYPSDAALAAALRVEFDSQTVLVDRVLPHPQFSHEEVSPGITRYRRDLGLLFLKSTVAIAPLAIHRGGALARGQGFTQVGVGGSEFHGFDGNGLPILDGLGEKRAVELTISDVSDDDLIYGDATRNVCHADSGGPALMNGVIIGVSSSFVDGSLCHGRSSSQRTSAELAFLDGALGISPSPSPRASDGGGCSIAAGRGGGWWLLLLTAAVARRGGSSTRRRSRAPSRESRPGC